MLKKGMWIEIHSYKHDGSLHRCWQQDLVIENNDDFFVMAGERTKVTEADGRRWYTREPAIAFFAKKEWFNVIAMIKTDGVSFYCNIASPTLEDRDILKYIDYDLDLKLYPNGTIRILDEREYARHRTKYQYSDKLDSILKHEVERIFALMQNNVYPFQPERVMEYYREFKDIYNRQHAQIAMRRRRG